MPDISMCKNTECPLKDTCYRFTATPSEPVQSYSDFKYDEKKGCDYYWKIKKKIKKNERFLSKNF